MKRRLATITFLMILLVGCTESILNPAVSSQPSAFVVKPEESTISSVDFASAVSETPVPPSKKPTATPLATPSASDDTVVSTFTNEAEEVLARMMDDRIGIDNPLPYIADWVDYAIITNAEEIDNPIIVRQGDVFQDFVVDSVECLVETYSSRLTYVCNVNINFIGTVTLHGKMSYFISDTDILYNKIVFQADESDRRLVPIAYKSGVGAYFTADKDSVSEDLAEGVYYDCEVTISNFHLMFYPTTAFNYADIVSITYGEPQE